LDAGADGIWDYHVHTSPMGSNTIFVREADVQDPALVFTHLIPTIDVIYSDTVEIRIPLVDLQSPTLVQVAEYREDQDDGTFSTPISSLGIVAPPYTNPGTLYVDGATGSNASNNCQNSTIPCQAIAYAISQAVDGDTILLTAGTYTENLTISGITLTLRGGYTISDTQWLTGTGKTIINGNRADRVFLIHGSNSVLENLTITDGQSPSDQYWGGGVWVTDGDVTIRSSTITGNYGGGIEANCDWGPARLTLEDSVLVNNYAGAYGGGMNASCTSANLTNVLIISNTSEAGGAMSALFGSDVTIQNSTMSGNQANEAILGEAVGGPWPAITILNSIVWGNTGNSLDCSTAHCDDVTYSDVEGERPGTGNTDADPMFVDAANGDYHLSPGSPCIDAGIDTGLDTDFEGDPRPFDGDGDGIAKCDMGADEWVGTIRRIYLPLTLRDF